MQEQKNKEQGITLITLVVTIIILIILAGVSISTLVGDNGIITKTKQARENIIYAGEQEQEQLNQLFWEMDQEGIYTEDEEDAKKDQMIELLQKQVEELKEQIANLQQENTELQEQVADLNAKIEELNKQITDLKAEISEKDIQIADLKKEVATKQETINNLQSQLDTINSQLAQTNATAAQILKNYKAYSKGQLVTGTMANNGAVSKTLNAGQSYTIPAGYHNGSGKVTANSLASQTSATATAADIASGKTAWVNGNRITGTMSSITNSKVVYQNKVGNGAVTWTYTPNVTGNFLVVYSGGNGGSTKSNTSLTSITGYQSIQVLVNNYQGIDTSLTYPWSSWSYVAIVKMNANTTLKISAGGNAKTVSIIQLGS